MSIAIIYTQIHIHICIRTGIWRTFFRKASKSFFVFIVCIHIDLVRSALHQLSVLELNTLNKLKAYLRCIVEAHKQHYNLFPLFLSESNVKGLLSISLHVVEISTLCSLHYRIAFR